MLSSIGDLVREFSKITNPSEIKPPHNLAPDPSNEVGHEIGINTVDDAGVDITYLKQHRSLGILGATIETNHTCHPHSPSK